LQNASAVQQNVKMTNAVQNDKNAANFGGKMQIDIFDFFGIFPLHTRVLQRMCGDLSSALPSTH
jgi:hypothetical protein